VAAVPEGSRPSVEGEAELLRALKAGEEEAYERLVRLHSGRLLAVARRFLDDPDEAQDALQDAFLSAFRSVERFEGGSLLSTWLHAIVVNACLMRLRTRRRRPEEPLEPLLPVFDETDHQVERSRRWPDLEGEAVRKEAALKVHELIRRLPESYRTVLLLRDIEEFDTARTAEALGVTENAVKIRLHRARQALRTLLDPELLKSFR
jgi:RNA polymerase sigma-70 factor, ECF subfamily